MSAKRELAELRDHFDERVRDRAEVILRAQKIAPDAFFGSRMTDAEIRARAVAYAKGHAAIDGRSSEYIEALFDHLSEQQPIDPVRLAMIGLGRRPH